MSLFGKKKAEPKFEYDPNRHKAVLKCSICNGEQVAGLFQELYRNGNSEEFLNRG